METLIFSNGNGTTKVEVTEMQMKIPVDSFDGINQGTILTQTTTTTQQKRKTCEGILRHPVTGEPLSLAQAVAGGMMLLAKGLFVRPDTGEEFTFKEAVQKEYISQQLFNELNTPCGIIDPSTGKQLTLLEASKLGIFSPEEGLFKDPETGKLLTPEEAANVGFVLLKKVSNLSPVIASLRPSVSIYSAINSGDVDVNTGRFVDRKTGTSLILSEAFQKGYLTTASEETEVKAPCLADLVSLGKIDNSGKVLDSYTGNVLTMKEAIEKNFISDTHREVVNPSSGNKLTLREAINKQIINTEKGTYDDKERKVSIAYSEAVSKKMIYRPLALGECFEINMLSDKNTILDPFSNQHVTLLDSIGKGIVNADIKCIKRDDQDPSLLSLAEAFSEGLVAPSGSYLERKTNSKISLNEAVRKGYILSVVVKSLFEIAGIKDHRKPGELSFKEAFAEGLLDKTGKIWNPDTSEYVSLEEGVALKLIHPQICEALNLPSGLRDQDGIEVSVLEAVCQGQIDPNSGGLVDPSSGLPVNLTKAVSDDLISSEGASVLRGIQTVTVTSCSKVTVTTKLSIEERIEDISIPDSIIPFSKEPTIDSPDAATQEESMVKSSSSTVVTDSFMKSGSSGVDSPTVTDETSPTKSFHNKGMFSSISRSSDLADIRSPEDSVDSAMEGLDEPDVLHFASPISSFNLSLDDESLSSQLFAIPQNGWTLNEAVNQGLLDTETGLLRVPDTDRLVGFKESIQLGIINPNTLEVINPANQRVISVSRALEKGIIGPTGHYILDKNSTPLTLQEALNQNLIRIRSNESSGDNSVPSELILDPQTGSVKTSSGVEVGDILTASSLGILKPESVTVRDLETNTQISLKEAIEKGLIDEEAKEYVDKSGNKMSIKKAASIGLLGIGAVVGAPFVAGALAAKAIKGKLNDSKGTSEERQLEQSRYSQNTDRVETKTVEIKVSQRSSETGVASSKNSTEIVVVDPVSGVELTAEDAIFQNVLTENQLKQTLASLPPDLEEATIVTTVHVRTISEEYKSAEPFVTTLEAEAEFETTADISDASSREASSTTVVTELVIDRSGSCEPDSESPIAKLSDTDENNQSTRIIEETTIVAETIIVDPKTGKEHSLDDALALGLVSESQFRKIADQSKGKAVNVVRTTDITDDECTVSSVIELPNDCHYDVQNGTVSTSDGLNVNIIAAATSGMVDTKLVAVADPESGTQISLDDAVSKKLVDPLTGDYMLKNGERIPAREAAKKGLLGLAAVVGAPVIAGALAVKAIKDHMKKLEDPKDQAPAVKDENVLVSKNLSTPIDKDGKVLADKDTISLVKKDRKATDDTEEKGFGNKNEKALFDKEKNTLTDKEGITEINNDKKDLIDKDGKALVDNDRKSPVDKEGKAPADKDEKGHAEKDEKAPADKDEKAPADKDEKAPADKDEKAPADKDDKAPADKDGKAPLDKDGKAPVDKDGKAPVDKDGMAPVEKDGKDPVDKDGNALVDTDGIYDEREKVIRKDEFIAEEERNSNTLPTQKLGNISDENVPSLTLKSSEGVIDLGDGSTLDLSDALKQGLVKPDHLTIKDPSTNEIIPVNEAIKRGVVDDPNNEVASQSGKKFSIKDAAKMGLVGVAAVLGSPLIAGAVAAKAIKNEIDKKKVPTNKFDEKLNSCDISDTKTLDPSEINGNTDVGLQENPIMEEVCPIDEEDEKPIVKDDEKRLANEDGKPLIEEDGKPLITEEGKALVDKDGKPLVDKDGKPLVDKDGKPLVDKDGKPLLDKDGKAQVDEDGKPLVDKDGKPLVDKDGKPLVNKDGKPLVDKEGKPLIDKDGKPLLDKDGKAQVDEDGKPLVDKDGKPLVDKDGKPLVDKDGKPLVDKDGKPLVDKDGKPLLDKDGKPLLDKDGKPLLDKDGKPLLDKDGKAQFDEDGKPLVDKDGKPLVDKDGKPLVDKDGKPLVDKDGKPLVDKDGKPLVDKDGKPLVDKDGKPLVDKDGKPLVDKDGKPLVDKDGKPLVDKDGKPLVDKDGKPLVDKDGKLLVDKDGKLLVDKDGKPLVDKDGKPLLDKDGKPLLDKDGKPLVDKDGKPLVDKDGKPLVDKDGKPLVDKDGKPLVDKDGKALVDEDGKALVDEDGKPLVDEDGKPLVDEDGKPLVDEDGKPLVDEDGKPLVDEDGKLLVDEDGKPLVDEDGKPLVDKDGKVPVKKDRKAPVDKDGKAPVDKDGKAPVDKDGKAPVDKDGKAPVDKDVKAPVDKDGKALVDKDGKALVDKDGKALVDKDGKALVDKDRKALVDKDGNALVDTDGIYDKREEVIRKDEFIAEEERNSNTLPTQNLGNIPDENVSSLTLKSSEGVIDLGDGSTLDLSDALKQGLVKPDHLTIKDPSTNEIIPVNEAIKRGVVDDPNNELACQSGKKFSIKDAAKMGLVGVAAVLGSPLIAGAVAAKAIKNEIDKKKAPTNKFDEKLNSCDISDAKTLDPREINGNTDVGKLQENPIMEEVSPIDEEDGKPIVKDDEKRLANEAGKPFVDEDGKLLVDKDEKPLLDEDEKPLLDEDGNPLVDEYGNPLVDEDGKPLVDEHGKPLVDKDGKPLVDKDGKPLVDEDGKPLIYKDGKPLVDKDGKPLVDKDGKPLVDKDGKPLVDKDGKPLVDKDGKPLVDKDGKPLVVKDGKPLVDKDGKPLVDKDGKPLVDKDGKPLVDEDGKPLVDEDGKPLVDEDGKPLSNLKCIEKSQSTSPGSEICDKDDHDIPLVQEAVLESVSELADPEQSLPSLAGSDRGTDRDTFPPVEESSTDVSAGEIVLPDEESDSTSLSFPVKSLEDDAAELESKTIMLPETISDSISIKEYDEMNKIAPPEELHVTKMRRLPLSLEEAKTAGLININTFKVLSELTHDSEKTTILSNHFILDVISGKKVSLLKALEIKIIDLSEKIALVPVGRPLELQEALHQGLFDPSTQKIRHPENGSLLTLKEAVLADIIDPATQLKIDLEVTDLLCASDQKLIDHDSSCIHTSQGDVQLIDAIERKLFLKADDWKATFLPPLALTFPTALEQNFVDLQSKEFVHPFSGSRMSLAKAVQENYILYWSCPVLPDSIHLLEAIDNNLIDPKFLTLPSGIKIPLREAVESGLLVIAPQQLSPAKLFSTQKPVQSSSNTVALHDMDNIYDESTGKFKDPKTGELVQFSEAVEKNVVDPKTILFDPKSGTNITAQKAIESGMIDPKSGDYVDPGTGSKLKIKDAVAKGMLAVLAAPIALPVAAGLALGEAVKSAVGNKKESFGNQAGNELPLALPDSTEDSSLAVKTEVIKPNAVFEPNTNSLNLIDTTTIEKKEPTSFESKPDLLLKWTLFRAVVEGVYNCDSGMIILPSKQEPVSVSTAIKARVIDTSTTIVRNPATDKLITFEEAITLRILNTDKGKMLLGDKVLNFKEAFKASYLFDCHPPMSLKKVLNLLYDQNTGKLLNPKTGQWITLTEFCTMNILDPNSATMTDVRGGDPEKVNVVEAINRGLIDGEKALIINQTTTTVHTLIEGFSRGLISANDDAQADVSPEITKAVKSSSSPTDIMTLEDAIQQCRLIPEKSFVKKRSSMLYLSIKRAIEAGQIDPSCVVKFIAEVNRKNILCTVVEEARPIFAIEPVKFEIAVRNREISLDTGMFVKGSDNLSLMSACDAGYLDESSAVVKDVARRRLLDLKAAGNVGLLSDSGQLLNSYDNSSQSLRQSMGKLLLTPSHSITLLDAVAYIFDSSSGKFQNPFSNKIMDLKECLDEGIIDKKSTIVKCPDSNKVFDLEPALERGLLDGENGAVVDPKSGARYSLPVAKDLGYLLAAEARVMWPWCSSSGVTLMLFLHLPATSPIVL